MVLQYILNLLTTWSNVLLFIITCTALLLYSVLKNWWYFSNKNVKFIRGWPLIGSLHEFFVGNKSFADTVAYFYRKFPNEPFIGLYELTYPVYLIRDPELIKRVTTQDFEHFLNHQSNFDEKLDYLLARSLFFSRGNRWKSIRSILSASFTGNKMRMMFDLVCDCTNKFVSMLQNQCKTDNCNEFELKDLYTRYMCNIIATSAFGLEVDAFTDRDNEFYLAGKKITNFDHFQGVKLLLLDVIPTIIKFFRIPFLDMKLCNYFRNVVLTAVAYREKNNVFRPDMIQLLMEAQKGTLQDSDGKNTTKKCDLDDDDLVAQCAIFFFAGFETTSTLLSFMTHELACHPDIQQKLYEKIEAIEKQLDGKPITYEIIKDFELMEMVVSEVLRLWPPISQIDRQVTKPYRLNGNGKVVQLTTYDAIWIPIYALHRDPLYWQQPNHFDPNRFSEENRKNIHPYTYIPFGNGQRTCIASRFAVMVAKTFMYLLLRELKIERCDKTPDQVVLKLNSINMYADNGLWARFIHRKLN